MAGPSKIVGIDTQILIFAHKQVFVNKDQEQFGLRANRLIKSLMDQNTRIVISMITIGEYLAGVAENDRPKIGQEMMERYLVAPYNLRACVLSAKLTPMIKKLVDNDRQVLFADAKIVGSLAAYPCSVLYTYDLASKMAKIAQSLAMEVKPLPGQFEIPFN